MKLVLLACCLAAATFAQTAPSPPPAPRADLSRIPDGQEIVRIDGQPFTMGQYRTLLGIVAPASQAAATVDPGEFVLQVALMRRLAAMATEQKLDQESPLKEQLEYTRITALMQAELGRIINSPVVHQDEIEAFYNANRDQFKRVKLQAIKIAFQAASSTNGGKALTQDQATTKAARLVASLRGGADFAKLSRENSDDAALKSRDGEFQTVGPADNIPTEFRKAVFGLKPGEVTDPIPQPDGFVYILRAQEVTYRPLSEVQTDVYHALKQKMGQDAVEQIRQHLDVRFTNPAFPAPIKK